VDCTNGREVEFVCLHLSRIAIPKCLSTFKDLTQVISFRLADQHICLKGCTPPWPVLTQQGYIIVFWVALTSNLLHDNGLFDHSIRDVEGRRGGLLDERGLRMHTIGCYSIHSFSCLFPRATLDGRHIGDIFLEKTMLWKVITALRISTR
jgi:hypothetical protein